MSIQDFKAISSIVIALGKVKIFKKKLLKRQITSIGGLGTSTRNRLFPKLMKYSTIAKHSSVAVAIRTFPVPVQLKAFYKLFPFLLKDFPLIFGRDMSRDQICISSTGQK